MLYKRILILLLIFAVTFFNQKAAAHSNCIVLNEKEEQKVIEKIFKAPDNYRCLGWSVFHKAAGSKGYSVFFFIRHFYRDTARVMKLPDSFDVSKYCNLACIVKNYAFPKRNEPLVIGKQTRLPVDSFIVCNASGKWLYRELIDVGVFVLDDTPGKEPYTHRAVLNVNITPLTNKKNIPVDSIATLVKPKIGTYPNYKYAHLFLVYKNKKGSFFFQSHENCKDCLDLYYQYMLFSRKKGMLKFYSTYLYFPPPDIPKWDSVYESVNRVWFE